MVRLGRLCVACFAVIVFALCGHGAWSQTARTIKIVVGFSAGGGTAAIMAATYPDVFAGAATIAGIPYNCTTTGRDLADSQLFGHRRGAFTGAVAEQPGLIRSAASATRKRSTRAV